MKIIHLCSHKKGGAFNVANSLNDFLIDSKIDSKIVSNDNLPKLGVFINYIYSRLNLKFYNLDRKYQFSVDSSLKLNLRYLKMLKPDIIHVHWINSGLLQISELISLGVPIVWTLHDHWALTGGCHMSLGCERYHKGCGKCLALNSTIENDLSRKELNNKKKYYNFINFVAVSKMSYNFAKSRGVKKIELIQNNLDISFKTKKLKKNKHIVFCAVNGDKDYNKGFNLLLESIEKLANKGDYKLILIGFNFTKKINIKYESYSYLNDRDKYYHILSNAMMLVVPSFEETFSLVTLEALKLKTPVICYKNVGASDFIQHKENGYIFHDYTPDSLLEGIKYFMLNKPNFTTFEEVSTNDTYLDMYKKIINNE